MAVAQTSAHDRDTNNFSLFHVTEQVQLSKLPANLDWHVHTYWEFEEAELHRPHEVRVVIERPTLGELPSEIHTVVPDKARLRIRLNGLLFEEPGPHRIRADLRAKTESDNAAWIRCPTSWPILVETEK